MRRVLRWTAVAALGLVASAFLFLAFVPAFGKPSENELHDSLAREAGGYLVRCCMPDFCFEVAPRELECSVSEEGGGGADYRVRLRGERCWSARQLPRRTDGGLEERPSGCVTVGDQVGLSTLNPF